MVNDIAADTGCKTFINKIVRWITKADTIRAAQDAVIASNPNVAGWADCDVYAASGVHYLTTTDINNVADRVYTGMVTAFYTDPVTLGAGSDATATADAGGSAMFAYTLGAGADAVATADAGGGIASGLLLGAGADASATADAGGSALFAYSLVGAADAVRLVDAGGAIGDGSVVWPTTRAGEANTARVPFDGVRIIVPDADDQAAPVKAVPLYVDDTERLLMDWEAKYLPGAGDTAAALVALDAPAGVSVTPSVALGSALPAGLVVLSVTPTGAAGTYRVALRISTTGGRESTALVDVVVSSTVQPAKTFRLRSTADRDVFDLDFAAKYLAGAADVADVLLATSADAGLTVDARLEAGGVVQVAVQAAVDGPGAAGTYHVRTQLQTAAGRRKTGAIAVEVLA